jgi:DNA-binding CsgD family transcriptional regulator
MVEHDQYLQTIEAVYARGLDRDRLPVALEGANRLIGGGGATFEVIDLVAQRLTDFWSVGTPTTQGTQYIEQFAALNPRIPYASRQARGKIIWDYQILDEAEMSRDPFYAEFLPPLDLRYCLGAVIERTPEKMVAFAVQRSQKQGHADQREIALMQRLVPHFQQANDTAMRLKAAGDRQDILENALDWLADGVALIRADGQVVHANDALRALALRGDAFRIDNGAIEFCAPDIRRRFATALDAIGRLRDLSFEAPSTDFVAPRAGGKPGYTVSVRPLVHAETREIRNGNAVAMVFMRDPLERTSAAGAMLQTMFNLTNAEAHLAQALCTGVTTRAYASERRVTLNTVYSHLRRIRDKTGCKSVADLICKFSELNVPLRLS